MIRRYRDPRVTAAWALIRKYELWEKDELAVILGRERLSKIPAGTHSRVESILKEHPIDPAYIDEQELILNHDLLAFLEDRKRHLPPDLQAEFHRKMTSYDTEESAFVRMLLESYAFVRDDLRELLNVIESLAVKYRHTPMNARTHGQEAEIQSFGKRCLTWYAELKCAYELLSPASGALRFSKLSGAIGTNSGIEPELEKTALGILGFEPFAGATQIMPRILYAPLADALANIATVLSKIATDIRLGSRSGRPLWHEPFSKKQKGSSAMPHKKNNILAENICGMARMARKLASGLKENIETWEERSIEQSSVERVFWPDLFHVTIRAIKNMTKIMRGLVVYPDQMLTEIIECRGTYASNEAKELLTELGLPIGIERDDAYRIVQLACFNLFDPNSQIKSLRESPAPSLEMADMNLRSLRLIGGKPFIDIPSIQDVIRDGKLEVSDQLEADAAKVEKWNAKLQALFTDESTRLAWEEIFKPSHILKNEAHLFKVILGA